MLTKAYHSGELNSFTNGTDSVFSKASHERFLRATNVATKAAIVISANSVNILM